MIETSECHFRDALLVLCGLKLIAVSECCLLHRNASGASQSCNATVSRIDIGMFIGNRRTKHAIRAYRAPGDAVFIPKGALLRDVRTSSEPGYRFPIAMRFAARKNPNLHIFEYEGETLYMHFANGLMEATTAVTAR